MFYWKIGGGGKGGKRNRDIYFLSMIPEIQKSR